ncbi:hypothetical protein AYL99_02200 [Fonsecaea erecta]|uniref:Uncharacterized protein n=1 Tax=Fonsecaea erecta TaxID=1367422 RepID=A0A178ZUR0_9EURO|nr:hypothetical protein AYL99_02200 [Fonsecaea erecta]OAP62973.1 hypothetical protein AYL99_02200 [Fonsecaea erecta]
MSLQLHSWPNPKVLNRTVIWPDAEGQTENRYTARQTGRSEKLPAGTASKLRHNPNQHETEWITLLERKWTAGTRKYIPPLLWFDKLPWRSPTGYDDVGLRKRRVILALVHRRNNTTCWGMSRKQGGPSRDPASRRYRSCIFSRAAQIEVQTGNRGSRGS